MSVVIPHEKLPLEVTPRQAVEIAYAPDLAKTASDLARGLPVLIECEKDLVPFVFMNVRDRLAPRDLKCLLLDGRPKDPQQAALNQGFVGTMLGQLRDAVRGAVERRVVVLPHLDLLTTSQGGLTTEAREVIPLLYENPELVWLGFKDPSFPLPTVIENLFPHRYTLLGVGRDRLPQLITQPEARKFGREFNPWALYKYVSGMNAVRLRKLLSTLEGEDLPADSKRVYQQIRAATSGGKLEVPTVDLEKDIGGYAKVKDRLRKEILDVLAYKERVTDEQEVKRLEALVPRGMIFWGPPGTGKTLFAKAMATAIGAAITIVSGPELKSKWVGESEANLRQIFHRARQSAPAIIVFDELDSFAAARGSFNGSGVEHSMVNQLLTEMDGFQSDELVFIVGTTNFVEILDPALLRPGRFEFQLHIPYPAVDDRRAILEIYNRSMRLEMTEDALEYAVKRTGEHVEGAQPGTRFSGDHLNALCRTLARIRLREGADKPTEDKDIERALMEWVDRPKLTAKEEHVVATHEAGHAVVSLFCPHADPIDRISIQGDIAGALGYVKHQDPTQKYVVTQAQLLDDLCMLMGGREAELLLIGDVAIGCAGDLEHATRIADMLVEFVGLGGPDVGPVYFRAGDDARKRRVDLSSSQLEAIDAAVRRLLTDASVRAATILRENRPILELLRDELLKHKVIEAKTLKGMLPASPSSHS
jgi:cell division protease FtsH